MENHTAKHFVLQLGSLVGLYLSLSFLLVLLFGIINLLFPDAADTVWDVEQASSGVRIGIAMTIVFFPTYLLLTRSVNKTRRTDPTGSYLGLMKWLIYLSLLIAGIALLIDLVVVIMTFLEGDITLRFILKALAVLLVIGAAFYYYLLDARGVWLERERKSVRFAIGASAVVAVSLLLGFMNIETPMQVREQKIDSVQIQDLQEIQWQVQSYLLLNDRLPESLNELYADKEMPTAPAGRPAYEYHITAKGFELCATFIGDPQTSDRYAISRPIMIGESDKGILNPDDWLYAAGAVCFERVVKF